MANTETTETTQDGRYRRNATIRFTSCTSSAFDPVILPATSPANTTWRRFERTMKGEVTCPSGHYLTPWETATREQKTLARTLDRLLDERPFLDVDLFDNLYLRLRRIDAVNPEPHGILLMVVTPEPWQRDNIPSRNCSIDWLAANTVQTHDDVNEPVNTMLNRLDFYDNILEINTYLIDTRAGSHLELAFDIPLPEPKTFQPA